MPVIKISKLSRILEAECELYWQQKSMSLLFTRTARHNKKYQQMSIVHLVIVRSLDYLTVACGGARPLLENPSEKFEN